MSAYPSPEQIGRAAAIIRAGGLVAFPTETVYGLGADATNDQAVARIFAAKGRPRFNPLIVHVAELAAAERLARFDPPAAQLARRFWPGPLTLVLPRLESSRASRLCSAGGDTLALRMPAHAVARALLAAAGRPIAAPSANRSGRISPTTAAHVLAELDGAVDMVLDGGACEIGLESTVLDLSGSEPILLRSGGIDRETLEREIDSVVGEPRLGAGSAIKSPGMLASHYAPMLPLRCNVLAPQPGEAFVAFGEAPDDGHRPDVQLSVSGDLTEAAAGLYAALRAVDRPPFIGIAVMPIPERGIGVAINDRLRRAATR